ncbi:hypothetical protein HYW72_02565 [Candidatus Nomurabacteria bacterium]|nr:hypothetical protein [Candidatus Nomurabacteria bacterium]
MDEVFLRILLQKFEVSVASWGTGKAQNVSDLMREIQEGECYLRIDNDGVTRVLEIVKMHITDPLFPERGNLLEWSQTFPDSRVRERKQMPSEKLKGGETSEAALVRGLHEELELNPDGWVAEPSKTVKELRASPSYPNLPSVYIIHHFNVALNTDSPALRDEFTIVSKDLNEGTLYFRWEHLGQGKP